MTDLQNGLPVICGEVPDLIALLNPPLRAGGAGWWWEENAAVGACGDASDSLRPFLFPLPRTGYAVACAFAAALRRL